MRRLLLRVGSDEFMLFVRSHDSMRFADAFWLEIIRRPLALETLCSERWEGEDRSTATSYSTFTIR